MLISTTIYSSRGTKIPKLCQLTATRGPLDGRLIDCRNKERFVKLKGHPSNVKSYLGTHNSYKILLQVKSDLTKASERFD